MAGTDLQAPADDLVAGDVLGPPDFTRARRAHDRGGLTVVKYSGLISRTLIASVGTIGCGVALAIPASADPVDDPCPLAVTFLCRFVPIAPDLDHDVDLTQPLPVSDPAMPRVDKGPTAEVCVDGCG